MTSAALINELLIVSASVRKIFNPGAGGGNLSY